MYITSIQSKLITPLERALIGMSEQARTRETLYGEYKGIHIAIDRFKNKAGDTLQKRYIAWNEATQLIWYKSRRPDGRFEILA